MLHRLLAFIVISASCLASPAWAESGEASEQQYPDVVDVSVSASGENRFRFDVTLSSPYDTPQRYADAFRVMTREGDTLGVRELLHHHANEQPFTRSLIGVDIPDGVSTVIVQGRDQAHGYGGQTREVDLPER